MILVALIKLPVISNIYWPHCYINPWFKPDNPIQIINKFWELKI